MHDQLAQCTQHQKGKEAAEGIDEDQGRTCHCEASACTEKEPGTDRAADGDHLDLPRFQGLVITAVLFNEHFAFGRGGFHGFDRHCSSLRARFRQATVRRERPIRAPRRSFNEGMEFIPI